MSCTVDNTGKGTNAPVARARDRDAHVQFVGTNSFGY